MHRQRNLPDATAAGDAAVIPALAMAGPNSQEHRIGELNARVRQLEQRHRELKSDQREMRTELGDKIDGLAEDAMKKIDAMAKDMRTVLEVIAFSKGSWKTLLKIGALVAFITGTGIAVLHWFFPR